MSQHQDNIDLVWPQPPEGQEFARIRLHKGPDEYITTGLFPVGVVNSRTGKGRSVANCVRGTSFFFDADCVSVYTALRLKKGETLESTKDEQKAALYEKADATVVKSIKELIVREVGAHLTALLGTATLTIDSGWGIHWHWALTDCVTQEHLREVKELHKWVTININSLSRASILSGYDGLDVPVVLDAVHDTGSRLCRYPGNINHKGPMPRTVTVIDSSGTTLSMDDLRELISPLMPETPAAPATLALSATSTRPSAPGTYAREHIDFSDRFIEGRSWAEVVDEMEPGTRLNVVCPLGGTSPRSGFFRKDEDGSAFYTSNVAQATFTDVRSRRVTPEPTPAESQTTPPPPDMLRRTRNRIDNSVTNMALMLRNDPFFQNRLYWDDFQQRIMWNDAPATDALTSLVFIHMETRYQWIWHDRRVLWEALERVARLTTRNPVREQLEATVWDGVPRLDQWICHTVLAPGLASGCDIPKENEDLYRIFSRRWAISLVARALQPGCKVDTVLCLAGRQGFKKSTIFAVWGGAYFVDTELPADKDRFMILRRAWVYEDAELASASRTQEESRKALLSSREDTYRPPYGRCDITVKRHCVIVGTTNDASFLRDPTGSRRYWVVDCPSLPGLSQGDPRQPVADTAWLAENRAQLLAEAKAAYDAGEQWHLTAEEDEARARGGEKFIQSSLWDEAAAAAYAANAGGEENSICSTSFAHSVDETLTPSAIAKLSKTLVAALQSAGFVRATTRRADRRARWKRLLPAGVVGLGDGDGLSQAYATQHESRTRITWVQGQ